MTGITALLDDFRRSHLPQRPATTPRRWWQDGADSDSLISAGAL